jgi:predicted enzyme related to lactoylglutathione lyase
VDASTVRDTGLEIARLLMPSGGIAMLKMTNLLLGTDNPERLVEFYTKVLGDPAMSDGGYTAWVTGAGALTIGKHSEVHGQNNEPGRVIWFLETRDVNAEFERIKGLGGRVIAEPYGPAGPATKLATFADPDGNYFNLTTPFEMPA